MKASKPIVFCVLAVFISSLVLPAVYATRDNDNNWVANTTFKIRPQAASSPSGLTPAQVKAAYNLPQVGGSGTIAIIDAYDCPTVETDLATFASSFPGLPAPSFEKHKMASAITVDAGWALEISLDVQWAYAIAPYAHILLVEARSASLGDLLSAVNYARGRSDVVAVSMSWGAGEFSTQTLYDSYFTSSSGISFFASSGDNGAGVIWPSSSPNVVSVGGTTLNLIPSGSVASEVAWSGSGGGVSRYESKPSYQQTFGTSYAKRAVPDVSYNGDPASGVPVYDSTSYQGQSGWWIVGGTSAGAPQWAAIHSLGLSCSNANFYKDAKSAYSTYFRDIVTGSNGYSAGNGYDLVTGLGSPLTINFAAATTPDFSLSASSGSVSVMAGSSVTTSINVASIGGFSGAVTLSDSLGWATFSSNPVLGSGSSTMTINVPSGTSAGSNSITVTGTSGSLSHTTSVTANIFTAASAPRSLSASAGNSQVTLSWSAPTSDGGSVMTGYRVYRGTTAGQETLFAALGNVLTYVDSAVSNGQTYYYQVTANNAAGESPKSNEATATPKALNSLSVSVSTSKATYSRGSTVPVISTVTSGGNALSGATVSVTVTNSRGQTVWTGSGTTGINGVVTLNFRLSTGSVRGTYTVTAIASKTYYTSNSGTTTFSVT
jgi:hypothetical protein